MARQQVSGLQGLLGDSADLDAVVVGDPLGVYCRAWKWGKVRHVVFREQHKERVAITSGGVEQVTLEEALAGEPKVVIAVLGGAKIEITSSILGALMKKESVTMALVLSKHCFRHKSYTGLIG